MIPKSMNAVVTTGHGGLGKLDYRQVDVPVPAAGDVLIKVTACGLNNTDVWVREGAYGTDRDPDAVTGTGRVSHPFPLIQGADVVGEIVALGDGVASERLGQRVVCNFMTYADGPQGLEYSGGLGSSRSGGYAEYTTAPSSGVYETNSVHSDAELATLACAYMTAQNMLDTAQVASGETVLVTGASGGVGTALVQLAHARGAKVIAVTSNKHLASVQSLSPHGGVCRDSGDLIDQVLALAPEGGVDVVADVVAGELFSNLLACLKIKGRYVTAGAIGSPKVAFDVRTLYLKFLTFYGVSCGMPSHFEKVLELLEAGSIKPLLHATYPLSEFKQAQSHFMGKDFFGNIVVLPGS